MREETRIQRHIRKYLALKGFRTVHVPNGTTLRGDAKQRAIQMSNLKKDGLCPGFPDLLVYGEGGRIGHIEVKVEGGRQQDTQKDVAEWLRLMGHHYAICRSLEDVDETLVVWGWL